MVGLWKILPEPSVARRVDREMFLLRAVVVTVRWLRRLLPDALTVVPQARRYERASRTQS